ncbi:MAG: diaminopimelate epimerase [Phycisphaerae bacterium]|nr:diaminopimelate epimerase [Phycisphaerae bacterium]
MKFVKMHGLGNDYVYLDAVSNPQIEMYSDLPALARAMSDRHRGVGGDGIILLCRPTVPDAEVRMRMFNADGSEAEMCGNGVRCVAKFAHDRLGVRRRPLRVQTGRGVLEIACELDGAGRVRAATVDMGRPILDLAGIPVDAGRLSAAANDGEFHLRHSGADGLAWTFVSMGNPHAVCFVADPEAVARMGGLADPSTIERHPAFPNRVNVHVAAVVSPGRAIMRTWERGAGYTLACGTGACAVLVAGVVTGRLPRRAVLTLPGGELDVRWDEPQGSVLMTGPAEELFEGEWPDRR